MAKERVEEKKVRFGSPQYFIAAWAMILVIAFLTFRRADVGQLQTLIGNLGGGPLVGSGFLDSVAGAVVALLIVIAWFGVGSFATSFIRVSSTERILVFVMKTAVGAAIWSLIWFFLGLAGAYKSTVAVVAVVVGLALAATSFWSTRSANEESGVPEKFSGIDKALFALIAFPVLLALIASLAPPTAKDTLLYHFSVPKAFIAQGSNAFIEGNMASYLALGTEMHITWAMLLGRVFSERAVEAAAGATTFAFFPLLLIAIYGWARELKIDRRWGLLAVLLVATVPTVYHVAASGYVDLASTLYIALAIFALGRWWKTQETAWLVFISIFLGAALAAKLITMFVIAAFALMIAFRARQARDGSGNIGKIFANGFAALIFAGAVASPWYLRTWKETGSPVFPFYMSMWPASAPGWDVDRSSLIQAMNTQYGGIGKGPLEYLLTPIRLSIQAQPEAAILFDGVLGVAFLFGVPLLIWALWKFEVATEIKVWFALAAIMFLFWMFSSQQLRYLLPILPVLAIAIVVAGETISKRVDGLRPVVQGSLVIVSVAGLLVAVAWFLEKEPLRVVLGGESRDQYLVRNIDYFPYYQVLNNETAADAKVWLINMRRDTYHLDRPYFSDYLFEDWTLRKMIWESRNVHELKAKTAAMGVQYVLTRHDFLFDYDRSTIVDDKKPRSENEVKLKIAKEFILDKANTIRADEKFSLVKVF